MRASIATVSISGELPVKLEAIAKAGFDGVEIFENDFLAFDGSPRDVGRMVRDFGLEITLFQPFRDFEGMPEPHRTRTFERAERKFDVMQELGTDLLLVCSNVSPVSLGGIDRAAQDFYELGERAAKRGLRVGYEALAWGRHIFDHRDAWEIVRRADHPNVGLILDSFHSLARKIDIGSIRSVPKDKIFIVQLADAPLIEMDLLYWSRHFRNMPGEGDLPVTDFMAAIADTGYDGYFSLEIFNDQFRGGSARAIAADGHRSLIYLGDQVRRREAATTLSVPPMPDHAAVKGVAFIEFSVGEGDAVQLTAMLRALGFRKTQAHRTKEVSVYQQGEIRILVNTETIGFASAAYAVHGASAYALALEVEDAKAALTRAVALGAEPFSQPVIPGELEVPAIRGVGGGLVYLIDAASELGRIWEADFVSVPDEEQTASAHLIAVDHVAQTVAYDEMLTWLLFYTSIFEAEKSAMVDIIDPAGVVRSQVIENGEGDLTHYPEWRRKPAHPGRPLHSRKVRLGYPAYRVQNHRYLRDRRGAACQPLQISQNYYGDVEARFGLDPELTERLKAENILYDRDEQGEYFQLYSGTFAEGFFFEIVQRNGYRGYGAANAIFRIAALKKQIRPEGMPVV